MTNHLHWYCIISSYKSNVSKGSFSSRRNVLSSTAATCGSFSTTFSPWFILAWRSRTTAVLGDRRNRPSVSSASGRSRYSTHSFITGGIVADLLFFLINWRVTPNWYVGSAGVWEAAESVVLALWRASNCSSCLQVSIIQSYVLSVPNIE